MKTLFIGKLFLLLLVFLATIIVSQAQVPHKMSYQAVIRDGVGELVVNSNIGVQISILQGSTEGSAVFVERHSPTTNENGLVGLEIGNGTVLLGSMEEIDWGAGPYFMKTETDLEGGSNYTIAYVSELLSVPYALHAITAETLSEEIIETDPVFMDSPAADIQIDDIVNWDEAYSWGDHDAEGYLKSETDPLFTAWDKSEGIIITESQISDLQDYVVEESDPLFTSAFNFDDAQHGDLLMYDGATGQWVKFTPNYLTDFDEGDPIFMASPAAGILAEDIDNWDTAFNWGDHGDEDYLKSETDPLFSAWDKSEGISITESQISDLGEYLEEEVDPLFTASPASGILSGDIDNWDAAFDWGDHGDEGYLKSETDPLFTASPASGISPADIYNWDAAFNWGDHGEGGYLTEEVQSLADVLIIGNDAAGMKIKNLSEPVDASDAATKSYVDELKVLIQELQIHTGLLVQDIDGNVYRTVKIGNQKWMVENLRVTHYNNGDVIPTGLSNNEWENTTSGAYSIYPYGNIPELNSEAEVLEAYGALYNWYAVDDERGLCPAGWSVASNADWAELVDYVVSQGFPQSDVPHGSANALKSCRQIGSPLGGDCDTSEHPRWIFDNTHHGFDEFGFSALPGGVRWTIGGGAFGHVGFASWWWTATENSDTNAWYRNMDRIHAFVTNGIYPKNYGLSVRCLRDN